MIRVYSAQDSFMVANVQSVLSNQGIPSEVRTPFLAVGSGEIPFAETWTQLWILNDEDLDRATKAIDQAVAASEATGPWKCSSCGELVDAPFETCWQCGAERPSKGS
jgi:hypothetical protein